MDIYEWDLLNKRKPLRKVIDDIIFAWELLLSSKNITETKCHKFIKDNTSLFFWDSSETIEISEFYLNTDKKIDLVIGSSQYSYGFEYNLIELEAPNSPLFVKKKTEYVPSNDLAVAIEQINSWKTWVSTNKSSAMEFFPSKRFNIMNDPIFNFKIFIGRRTNNNLILQKINEYNRNFNIQIHSYDYLTDCIKRRYFFDYYDPLDGALKSLDNKFNEYANPFRKAYKFSDWKNILREEHFSMAHMIKNNIENLLSHRKYSNNFDIFRESYNKYKNIILNK